MEYRSPPSTADLNLLAGAIHGRKGTPPQKPSRWFFATALALLAALEAGVIYLLFFF